jgi:hypothetical protein
MVAALNQLKYRAVFSGGCENGFAKTSIRSCASRWTAADRIDLDVAHTSGSPLILAQPQALTTHTSVYLAFKFLMPPFPLKDNSVDHALWRNFDNEYAS